MVNEWQTERLSMRQLAVADHLLVAPLLQQKALMKWFGGPLTEAEIVPWLRENLHRYQEDGYSYLLVQDRLLRVVGLMGLLREEIQGRSYIGLAYLVASQHQGRGYAKEGLRALLAQAFDELQSKEVVVQVAEENEASQRFAKSLGFQLAFQYQRQQGTEQVAYQVYRLEDEQWEGHR